MNRIKSNEIFMILLFVNVISLWIVAFNLDRRIVNHKCPETGRTEIYYISNEETEEETTELTTEEKATEEQTTEVSDVYYYPILTKSKGVNYNVFGNKETYYNLPMSGVISIMRNMGFDEDTYPYWIREDGCKMFGDYIIVAASFKTYPRGTIVNTSLGKGLVCDTGGFAEDNPYQLDIAVSW